MADPDSFTCTYKWRFSEIRYEGNIMRKSSSLIIMGLTLWALTAAIPPSSPASGRIHYSTLYNPATVETVQGEVASLGRTISGNGRDYCETLSLKTDAGTIQVILKPESFRPRTNLRLQPGDQVAITGSRVALPGETVLIAATVAKGGNTMVLRDLDGRPAWAVGDDWHVR
jgi:hypothetical protein